MEDPQRLRADSERLEIPNVSSGSGPVAAERRPWTFQRIRRGLVRRGTSLLDALRDRALLPIAAKGGLAASMYYAFASGALRREHVGVVRGRRAYARQARELAAHEYLLRRNVHMLEKGLVMRPRRPVFAIEYINATVVTYGAARSLFATAPELVDRAQLQWAHDVLANYFAVAGPHKTIEKVRAKWDRIEPLPDMDARRRWPYRRDLSGAPTVAYEDLLRLAYRRRSVRWYLPKPVPRELIDQAIEVAVLSPSACNRQPFEFRVFDDPDRVLRVASLPKGTRGFVEGVPAFVVIVGRLRAFFSERDRHLIYIDGSLAAMSFALALETLGLSSCFINWPDDPQLEREMAAELNLERDERVVVCLSLGYPDPEGGVPHSEKRPLEWIRRYN